MLRVVHLFDVKKGLGEQEFVEWLDSQLEVATRQFGCVDRRTWRWLDGFGGSYMSPKAVQDRPKYVNEAYWPDVQSANRFRNWLTETSDGRKLHDHWFASIENHTVLRYVEGWDAIPMEG